MHAVKRSPLFRIALLSLAVLSAHTARAAKAPPVNPVRPPCPAKVAAAQPEAQKKLLPNIKRLAQPGARAHPLFGGAFALTGNAAAFLPPHSTGQLAAGRHTVYIPPQRLPFDLRI